ncbi:hypothetical protein FH972_004212 [Carpinus fangiana]|uniref:(S)-hydroxynitrile lyase n=1 Tax=Carpinus fangiana TaxID=176857 RepID=A0A5N6QL24_9ROSI|nr:hypothetical protein FH972_004212 [Carpinus fangiana]
MEASREQTHFVLVHGACHGAWCWHKLKPRLESAGHLVTALDLAASGINMKAIRDVHTLHDYNQPLLDLLASLPPNQKVVLVGHSLGGLNLALAIDKYPEKVAVGVFVTASMPDTTHKASYVLDQDFELAKTLVRPASLFREDLSKTKNFSNEGYGSVLRVYVVCDEDLAMSEEFQRWMIENSGAKDVMEIKGADHMPMLSKPQELCHCLLEIARKYA